VGCSRELLIWIRGRTGPLGPSSRALPDHLLQVVPVPLQFLFCPLALGEVPFARRDCAVSRGCIPLVLARFFHRLSPCGFHPISKPACPASLTITLSPLKVSALGSSRGPFALTPLRHSVTFLRGNRYMTQSCVNITDPSEACCGTCRGTVLPSSTYAHSALPPNRGGPPGHRPSSTGEARSFPRIWRPTASTEGYSDKLTKATPSPPFTNPPRIQAASSQGVRVPFFVLQTALAAENLFLRKQLALYRERPVKPAYLSSRW
jgi:hypothetical protein